MWGNLVKATKISGDEYSFDNMFKEVAHFLKEADLTIGNLGTTFSGRKLHYQQKHLTRSWPKFNCQDELARTLKVTGFDVLTTANNHCLDRGPDGLKRH